jgi:hypothetical protein
MTTIDTSKETPVMFRAWLNPFNGLPGILPLRVITRSTAALRAERKRRLFGGAK